ncbi:hypothetical protein BC834DRAFT_968037 [Gloeopeniophorella convolvens]|nr:hypothetical protein BC834DRAFT_968037 [Gloeopeniophorella convolvens]
MTPRVAQTPRRRVLASTPRRLPASTPRRLSASIPRRSPVPTPTPLRRVSAPSQGSQIIGRRRARPDEDEDDEDDELVQAPARTRRRVVDSCGGIFGIMGDMWRPIDAIITHGLERSNYPDASDTMFSSQDNKYWELFQLLLSFRPNLIQECANQGENGPMSIADDIDVGRSKTRNVIIFAVKKTILDWYDFGPTGPHVDNKEFRGFRHPIMGRLLCPAAYKWDDPAVQTALITHDPKYPTQPRDWPVFLWENETVDKDTLFEGFLRGRLLVKTAKQILFGPATANEEPNGRSRHVCAGGGNSKPRALQHHVRRATSGLIAYGATVVHFALSSQATFYPGGKAGRWPYEKFYNLLVWFIDVKLPKANREELLDWWNLQLFGYSTEIDNGDLSAEIESDPTSVLSLMLAQLMAGEEEPDDNVEMRPSEEPGDEEDESMEPDGASGSA